MSNLGPNCSGAVNIVLSRPEAASKQLSPKMKSKTRRPAREFNIRCGPVWQKAMGNMLNLEPKCSGAVNIVTAGPKAASKQITPKVRSNPKDQHGNLILDVPSAAKGNRQ